MNSICLLFQYSAIWRDLLKLFKSDPALGDGLFREARSGSIKPTDALIVAKLLRRHKPQTVLEIGSFLGVSTRWLLDVSQPWNARLTAVDPNIPHRVFAQPRLFVERLSSRHDSGRLEIVSAFFGTPFHDFPEGIPVLDERWGRTFDLIFIDGDHSYEAVAANFRLGLKMLAPGGVMVFHDALSWPGVTRFMQEIAEEFAGKAEVSILGETDRKLLRLIGRANDGIGYFRLTN